jgi:enoyl-CoA hydratase/carnithine racemase
VIEISRDGDVFVLRVDDGENRFRDDSVAAWNDALDQIERARGPKALVTTGTGRFYSNGLDLDWAMREARGRFDAWLSSVLAIYGRVLALPCHTVAAINGHAFGAGGQIALAHDFRVMRAERGYFCMPEVDLKAPLHPGMTAILKARLPRQTFHEVVTTGRRYGGADALAAGIVEHAVAESEVLPRAIAIAQALAAKADPIVARLRTDAYPELLEALRAPMPPV